MVVELNKDEQKKIFVKYGDKKKLFSFRWTLFSDGSLIVFKSYDKIVAQHILYLRDEHQSFRFDLKAKEGDYYSTPSMLVKFSEYKSKEKKAVFLLFLFDKKQQITLEPETNASVSPSGNV